MEAFIGEDFLLETETAKRLYHQYAAKMPIVDYHCHLSPKEIYENKAFADIAEAWLGGDHYKWRLMRAFGVAEHYITGDATSYEKFEAFAKVMPYAIGNPVYHWAHLELKRYFDCDIPLSAATAKEIWDICNAKLKDNENMRARGIIQQSGVTTLVTTDEPFDSLEWHAKLRDDASFTTKVLPAFRPDKIINIDKDGFAGFVAKLGEAAGMTIATFADLTAALANRIEHFHSLGCCASDHGVDEVPVAAQASAAELNSVLQDALSGNSINPGLAQSFKVAVLQFLGEQYAQKGWVMEIHFGAQRNTNTKGFTALGPDTGYDCIRPQNSMLGLAALLDRLKQKDRLPKTLIFSLNPNDNAIINTLCGCFSIEGVHGGVQQGSAWWFNDTKGGMEEQMKTFASQHVLGTFLGMLTDSRSFLSYTRHEYFRRILCNIIGSWVENGEYPADEKILQELVQNISYNNAMAYFGY